MLRILKDLINRLFDIKSKENFDILQRIKTILQNEIQNAEMESMIPTESLSVMIDRFRRSQISFVILAHFFTTVFPTFSNLSKYWEIQ